MRPRPAPSWLAPLLLAACSGDATPGRPCDRLGLLCGDDDLIHHLRLDDTRNVSADLDADGKLDLVTAAGSAGLSIVWSSFDTVRDYRQFPGPVTDAKVGDLDRDGHPDIVLVTSAPSALHILTGTGTRELIDGPTQPLAGRAQALWLGQLDADDRPDAVVASGDAGTLTVLTDGLTRARPIVLGRNLVAVDVGDLDGDDDLDLVTLDQADAAVYVVLASGDTFAAPRRISTGLGPTYLQILDHDGDGHTDVLTHGKGPEIWFHQGDGSGGFAPARALLVQKEASNGFGAHRDDQGHRWLLTIADKQLVAHHLNDADQVTRRVLPTGDLDSTRLEMDAGAPLQHGEISLRHSLAPAHIFSEQWHGGDGYEQYVLLGDLDLDGDLDLVTADDFSLSLHQQLSEGTWSALPSLPLAEPAAPVAIADVTGDARPDILLLGSDLQIAVADDNGGFTLAPPAPLPGVGGTVLAGLAQLGPGPSPVIVARRNTPGIRALRFDATGQQIDEQQILLDGPAVLLAAADLDGDGGDDLVAIVRAEDDTLARVIIPALEGGWGPPRSQPLSAAVPKLESTRAALALGDLDLDGTIDAAIIDPLQVVRLHDLAADPPTPPAIDTIVQNDIPRLARIADVDHDGAADIVYCASEELSVLLARDTGGYTIPIPMYQPFTDCSLHVDPQTLQASAAIATRRGASFLQPELAPGFAIQRWFRGSPPPFTDLATADLDADGHIDIITSADNDITSGFAVLWGRPDGAPRRAQWRDGIFFHDMLLATGPLDDAPGDELVTTTAFGPTTIWTHAEGSLRPITSTQIGAVFSPADVGVQARANGPADVIVLAAAGDDKWRMLALPRDASGQFIDRDAFVSLWSGRAVMTPPALTIADFDGDGHDDIAVRSEQNPPVQLVWGDEQRATIADIPSPPGTYTLAHADLDGDGRPELVLGTIEGVLAYTFAGRTPELVDIPVTSPTDQGLLVADLEADGYPDILRVDGDHINVTLRSAAGIDRVQLPFDPNWQHLRAADLDSDGILDLLGLQDGNLVTRLSAPQEVPSP